MQKAHKLSLGDGIMDKISQLQPDGQMPGTDRKNSGQKVVFLDQNCAIHKGDSPWGSPAIVAKSNQTSNALAKFKNIQRITISDDKVTFPLLSPPCSSFPSSLPPFSYHSYLPISLSFLLHFHLLFRFPS